MSQRKISAKHALTKEELDFCKKYLAGLPAATAYRRAFFPKLDDGDPELPDSKKRSQRAHDLLKQDYIKRYLTEVGEAAAGDNARTLLAERALFDDDRMAAEKILEQEDKLGMQDAFERWAEVMCAIGTEVVVPVPGGGEVVFPLREMFPRFAEALPPVDAIEKTIRTLEDYRAKLVSPGDDPR
jgi:hypothetical protein